jgi:competence protein ComEC
VLPLLSAIMLFGVLVMAIATFTALPIWCIKPLEWGITFMNSVIHWVASFESFIFTNIPSTFYLTVVSYGLLIALVLWWKKNSFTRIVFLLTSIIMLQLVVLKNKLDYGNSTEWVVLNASKKTIICQRIGKEIEVISNDMQRSEIQKNTVLQNYATASFSTIKKKKFFNECRLF